MTSSELENLVRVGQLKREPPDLQQSKGQIRLRPLVRTTPRAASRRQRVLVAGEGFSAGGPGAAYCWGSAFGGRLGPSQI